MSPAWQVATVWLVAAAIMAATWRLSLRVRNIGYVDVAWAGLMALAAVLAGTLGNGDARARTLVAVLGGLWGTRLCLHLLSRVRAEPEDGRYQALRARWGASPARWFVFFQGQALVVALFSLPFVAAANGAGTRLDTWIPLAVLTWLVAVGGEWLADRQLARFRANPSNHGRTCRVGLWAWSRHPNYFFEWLGWVAYPVIAIDLTGSYWWGLASLVAPAMMYWLLAHVSGVPPLEEHMLKSRGDAFRAYQRRVSAFFPTPPKTQEQA